MTDLPALCDSAYTQLKRLQFLVDLSVNMWRPAPLFRITARSTNTDAGMKHKYRNSMQ